MAHFALTRADLNAWADGTAVEAAEYWDLDQKTFAAINGDAGGTWAPTAPIIIGGDGLNLTGLLDIDGAAIFDGAVTFNAAVTFNENCTAEFLAGTLKFTSGLLRGTASVNTGNPLTIGGTGDLTLACENVNLGGGAGKQLAITAGTAVDFNGVTADVSLVTFSGACAFNNTVELPTITGPTNVDVLTVTDVLDLTQVAAILHKVQTLPDANSTVDPTLGEWLYAAGATSRTYSLSHTGAGGGMIAFFIQGSAQPQHVIKDGVGGSTIATLALGKSLNLFYYDGANWSPMLAMT